MSEGKAKKTHDLPQRIGISCIAVIIVAAFLFVAEYPLLRWVFAGAVATITGLVLYEYFQLLRNKGLEPPVTLGIVLSILYVFALFYKTQGPHAHAGALWQRAPDIILGITFFAFFAYYAFRSLPAIVHIGTAFLGIVYVAIPLGMLVRIMYFFMLGGVPDVHFQGTWWVIYLIAVTKSADMGGYFVGRFLGRAKLAGKISPKKTIEGALGGLLGSVLMSLLICYLGKKFGSVFVEFSYFLAIWVGLLIGVLGQLGDLAESVLKRDAGVKDSNSIPAVGGLLDMVDSLLFTAPVVFVLLRVLYT